MIFIVVGIIIFYLFIGFFIYWIVDESSSYIFHLPDTCAMILFYPFILLTLAFIGTYKIIRDIATEMLKEDK